MKSKVGLGYSLLVAGVLVGCARIASFDANPRNACVSDEIQVSWEASGNVWLSSQPDLEGTGEQESKGSRSFRVEEPTRFELDARALFGDDSAQADIDVAPPQHTFGETAECVAEEHELRSVMTLSTQLSAGFHVSSVRNVLSREVGVAKDGREVALAPGAESSALEGAPVLGTWTLSSPLGAGEDCTSALQSIRQRLRVEIRLRCGD